LAKKAAEKPTKKEIPKGLAWALAEPKADAVCRLVGEDIPQLPGPKLANCPITRFVTPAEKLTPAEAEDGRAGGDLEFRPDPRVQFQISWQSSSYGAVRTSFVILDRPFSGIRRYTELQDNAKAKRERIGVRP
jgi:hypothetical protein